MENRDKFMWCHKDFNQWVKEEKDRAREIGVRLSTSGVTKSLMDRVIKPHNIKLIDKPKKLKLLR